MAQLVITGNDAAILAARFNELAQLAKDEVLDVIGAIGVSQTQKRIAYEKRAPDGTPWKKNGAGTSTLMQEGHLLTDIHHQVEGDSVAIGSNLIYAAIHQFGGTIRPKKGAALVFTMGNATVFARSVTIPARPYLGLSAENEAEMTDAVNARIAELLQ